MRQIEKKEEGRDRSINVRGSTNSMSPLYTKKWEKEICWCRYWSFLNINGQEKYVQEWDQYWFNEKKHANNCYWITRKAFLTLSVTPITWSMGASRTILSHTFPRVGMSDIFIWIKYQQYWEYYNSK